jgi:nucleotide-binding universal stress UspA family protein
MISRLLLAVDVDTSSEATRVAGELAKASGATVEVFHADELDAHVDTAIWLDDDTEPREPIGNALAALQSQGITARVVTTRTTSRKLAQAVVHEGLDSTTDILVLGLPKPRHVGRIFVGSVAAEVAARTTIPLLLVPER